MSRISELTPQMAAYSEYFADDGEVRWLPYLMYFHPPNYSSDVVSTDRLGFRYSESKGRRYSVGDCEELPAARLLAGSSTVFGIGTTSDRTTLSSCLSNTDGRGDPWLNFGGRSFNSTQEQILFALHRHLLPPVKEIVLVSGFNDLGLARLPSNLRGEYGGFFMCHQFYDSLLPKRSPNVFKRLFGSANPVEEEEPPSLNEQLDYACALTSQNLANWVALGAAVGAKVRFFLQPLANWIRQPGCSEEEAIFAELEESGGFESHYGDILTQECLDAYASRLGASCKALDVPFFNLAERLRKVTSDDDWLFVDRIHFTDHGNQIAAQTILDALEEHDA